MSPKTDWYMVEKRITLRFYKNENGKEPVSEWLKDLDQEKRRLIGADIKTVEMGWPIGMPTCRYIGDGLYEVRTSFRSGIARVLFYIHENEMILLHGFIKKTEKIPDKELKLALDRKRKLKSKEKNDE